MKTKLSKLIFLAFLSIVFFGCSECNYISFSIDEVYTQTDTNHDVCNSKEAVILGRSIYDTDNGTAILYIPVPKGHSLRKIKQTKKSVSFITSGENFTNEFILYKVELGGFDEKEKGILTVFLEVKFTGSDLCGTGTLTEKKKKSEVQGAPLH